MPDPFTFLDDRGIQLQMIETSPKLLSNHLHEAWLRKLAKSAASSIGWVAGQRVFIEYIQTILASDSIEPNQKS
eukprot:7877904-Heterocapsa_arctica.AAC.1